LQSSLSTRQVRAWFWVILALLLILLAALLTYHPNYYPTRSDLAGEPDRLTLHTARIPASDPATMAIAVAQIVYPATFEDNKPNAVIVVPVEDWRAGLLAVPLIHFPINAPLLYSEKGSLSTATLREVARLDPQGVTSDGNTQVFLVGDIGKESQRQINRLGLKARLLTGDSIDAVASLLDDYRATLLADHEDTVLIVPREGPSYGLIAAAWAAHAGHSIFFADAGGISRETARSLGKRPQDAFIYVLADQETLPARVMSELSRYGVVQRIPGRDAYEISVGFAGYKDVGRNSGWWVRRSVRSFGWGIAEPGHNFTMVNPDYPQLGVPAALLSHMGRHGPILLVGEGEVPEPVERYLRLIQPSFISSQEQPLNRGWIVGDETVIGGEVQFRLDRWLGLQTPAGEETP